MSEAPPTLGHIVEAYIELQKQEKDLEKQLKRNQNQQQGLLSQIVNSEQFPGFQERKTRSLVLSQDSSQYLITITEKWLDEYTADVVDLNVCHKLSLNQELTREEPEEDIGDRPLTAAEVNSILENLTAPKQDTSKE